MRERDRQVVRLIALGMSQRDIAEIFGVSQVAIHQVARKPAAKAMLERLNTLADEYTAALIALGLTPVDIYPPARRGRRRQPVSPRALRAVTGAAMRARLNDTPPDPPDTPE